MNLPELSLWANLAVFLCLAAGIWFAGTYLTHLADTLADRLNLPKSAIGLLFLAVATSLPEVATTFTAAMQQQADLLLNNLFGGIVVQTTMLAVADYWVRGPITNYPRRADHILESVVLMILLQVLLAIVVIAEPRAIGHVGIGAIVLGLLYVLAVVLLRSSYGGPPWVPLEMPETDSADGWVPAPTGLEQFSSRRLVLLALLCCAAILGLGVAIVFVAEELSHQTGLGASFVGVSLLAAATSLPELSTTITAVRLRSYTLAISNILGSNLLMIALAAPADLIYLKGPILKDGGPSVGLTIVAALLVTTILCGGLVLRSKPSLWRLGVDSWMIVLVYAATILVLLS
ncbi:MAG: hypothetical protein ABJH63_13400 [Rhizobiaceae bacterium]